MRSRGLISVATTLVVSVALLGTAPAPTAPAAEAAIDSTVPAMSQETYLATIRALLAGQPGDSQSDETLIQNGESICADIDEGATYETFEDQMDQYGLNRAVYRVIIRAAVLTLCPDHSNVLP